MDSWLEDVDDSDKSFGPDLPLLFEIDEMWSVDSRKSYCQQMSDFNAKVHHIQYRLAAAIFYGPTSKGRSKGSEEEGGKRSPWALASQKQIF